MRTVLMVFTLLSAAVQTTAQPIGPASEPFRKWNVDGGVGVRFSQTDDAVIPHGNWDVEFGRYWTAHVKTSVGLMTAGQTTYSSPNMPQVYQTTQTDTSKAAFSGTVVYQFYENAFIHPYVVAGARFAGVSQTTTIRSVIAPYPLMSVETVPRTLKARPMGGGGFKSYFDNGRAFMRSELLMAVAPRGSAYAILQIGAGVDF